VQSPFIGILIALFATAAVASGRCPDGNGATIFTSPESPAPGRPLRVMAVKGTDIAACRDVTVGNERSPVPRGGTGVWPIARAWDGSTESLYSAWVRGAARVTRPKET
jgi:hypothetical protein